jgi:CheY-like chemotaxis protein
MLAHELRNPLASISSAVGLLKETRDPENTGWGLDVIDRQGRQLSRLVDDLLDVSRITRGKIELRRELLDAALCLENACEAARPLIVERGHTLQADIPRGSLWLEADPARLEQIVVNLLCNAAKYTPRGGTIWISARPTERSMVIEVRDSGIGIPSDQIAEMFELFVQGERSAARSEGGLGIGLTVVRALCQLHGGSVSAYSAGPGAGTTFTVRLPAASNPASAGRVEPGAGIAQNGGGMRVLIVDDNLDTAEGLARLLTRRDYQVRLAHDGPGALQKAREFSPAAILLDIGLPGMDGYEVVRRLRTDPECGCASIIAISGYGQEIDRRRSSEAGFDHHLVKPVRLEKLLGLL